MRPRDQRMEQMRRVRREYEAALVAAELLTELVRQDPSCLSKRRLRVTDFRNLRENLEDTFLVRLFAEFESGLREIWRRTVRDSHPRISDLLESLAARRFLPTTTLVEAHAVRVYRNTLVHEEAVAAEKLTLSEAERRLLRFFSYMPAKW